MLTSGEEQVTEVFFHEAEEFRAAVARLNYWGQDPPDVQFQAKGPIFEDGKPHDGELEETEEGPSVSGWQKRSCVTIPFSVLGGTGPAEGDHRCRLEWR